MSYLEALIGNNKAATQRVQSRRSNIDSLLTNLIMQKKAAAASAAVPPAAPAQVAQQGNGHFQGDGHNHANGKGLDPEFDSALLRLIKDSGGKISVGSGYRSIAEQTKIYNLWRAGKHPAPRVAKPGSSNHNFGLAADLKFADRAARAYAHANAARYGLRFPMGDEPWHVEPINARARRGRR